MTLHKRFSEASENITIAFFGGLTVGMFIMLVAIYWRLFSLTVKRRNTKTSNRSSLVLPKMDSPSFVESINSQVMQRKDSVETLNIQNISQISETDLETNTLADEKTISSLDRSLDRSNELPNSKTRRLTNHMGESALELVLGDYNENDDVAILKIVKSY
jgi:hypothetical protein